MKHLNLFNYRHSKYLVTAIVIAICSASFTPESSAQVHGAIAQVHGAIAQVRSTIYKPTAIASGVDINDILTDKDIPTGQKGFARDYAISAEKDERLEITVNSGSFDTVLSLIDSKGEVIFENDDAVGDGTNSLIFFKVRQSGNYIVRVSSFGGSSGGKFILRITKLRAI